MDHWPDFQRDTLILHGASAAGAGEETAALALFVQRLLARGGDPARIGMAGAAGPPACEISRAGAPLDPQARLVALDMPSLLHQRDCRTIALLAPARLRQDLAALDQAGAARLATLMAWQDALRHCTAALVFDPAHAALLLALGAPRVDIAALPALMPARALAATTDLLLVDHDGGTLADELAAAIGAALPELRLAASADVAQAARIHIHLGAREGRAPLRVIDSHAMHRPVIRLADPSAHVGPGMSVEPMRTGLCAVSIAATVAALRWLAAHAVFVDIFDSHATRAVEAFNGAAEAALRAVLLPGLAA